MGTFLSPGKIMEVMMNLALTRTPWGEDLAGRKVPVKRPAGYVTRVREERDWHHWASGPWLGAGAEGSE